MAYVEGMADYSACEISRSPVGAGDIRCGRYELDLKQVSNTVAQMTISGLGTKGGSFIQEGTLRKYGAGLFGLSFRNDVKGFVHAQDASSTAITDYAFTLAVDGRTISLAPGTPCLLRDEAAPGIVLESVTTYVNEHGKRYDVGMLSPMGATVTVGGQLYAVIDYYQNPAQIRLNRAFPLRLSTEQEDYLMAIMLAAYHFETRFSRDTAVQDSAVTISVD